MVATYVKPTVIPRWADVSGNVTEPSAAKKDAGWLFQDDHESSYENWTMKLNGEWWKWINERLDDGTDENQFKILNPSNGNDALTVSAQTIIIHNPSSGGSVLSVSNTNTRVFSTYPIEIDPSIASLTNKTAILAEGTGTGTGGEFVSGATGKGVIADGNTYGVFASASSTSGYGVYGAGGLSGYGIYGVGKADTTGGIATRSIGGAGSAGAGGIGLLSTGGAGTTGAGLGISTVGGAASAGNGGHGLKGVGGLGTTGSDGSGLVGLAYSYSDPGVFYTGVVGSGDTGVYGVGDTYGVRAAASGPGSGMGIYATGGGTGGFFSGGDSASGYGGYGILCFGGDSVGQRGQVGMQVQGGGSASGSSTTLILQPGEPNNAASYANLRLVGQVTLTGSAVEGDIYMDDTTHLLKFYNGTAWKTVATV